MNIPYVEFFEDKFKNKFCAVECFVSNNPNIEMIWQLYLCSSGERVTIGYLNKSAFFKAGIKAAKAAALRYSTKQEKMKKFLKKIKE